jgi:hypothetical protein
MERELPFLATIAGCLRWLEELLNILSGPLLVAGLGLALVDLLTDGALLTSQPELLYAWAIAMALGLDAQLVGTSAKLGRALRSQRYWTAAGCTVLVLALSYVAFLAAQVFATQEAHGWTTAQALSALGMDGTTWLIQRSALSVVLVVLSGLLRYTRPLVSGTQEERARLERELELEPLRAAVRMRKARGWRAVAASAFAKDAQTSTEPITDWPPTGPGTPRIGGASSVQSLPEDIPQMPPRLITHRLTPAERRSIQKRARANGLRATAFAALDDDPTLSRKTLRAILGCAQTTANSLYAEWDYTRQRAARELAQ